MRSKKIFVVTALTVDVDAGLQWQLRTQAYNLSRFLDQTHTICSHVALLILPPKASGFVPSIKEGKGTIDNIKSTYTKHIYLETNEEWARVVRYRPLAKLHGLKAALKIFQKSYFLFVDPDVVFTYSPFKRLSYLTETGRTFVSNCNSYLKSASIPEFAARRIYKSAVGIEQTTRLGGAQYLIAPCSISEMEACKIIKTAYDLFVASKDTLWIAEMLAWYECLPAAKLEVHKALEFKLAHAEFDLTAFGAGTEALMVHLAGKFDLHPSLLDKHKYTNGRSPFDEIETVKRENLSNPAYASWFYVSQVVEAQKASILE